MNMRKILTINEKFEELINLIQIKWDEHQQALTDIWDDNHVVIDREQASMVDYHEGAVEVLSLIHHYATELYNDKVS